jgi:hypothetical protein
MTNIFIPELYKRRVSYKTFVWYKVTLFLLAILVVSQPLIIGYGVYSYLQTNSQLDKLAKAQSTEKTLQARAARVQTSYDEIQTVNLWAPTVADKVPLAPLLIAIEKVIPENIALTKLSFVNTTPEARPLPPPRLEQNEERDRTSGAATSARTSTAARRSNRNVSVAIKGSTQKTNGIDIRVIGVIKAGTEEDVINGVNQFHKQLEDALPYELIESRVLQVDTRGKELKGFDIIFRAKSRITAAYTPLGTPLPKRPE